jgi:hypothetical protein
MAQKIPFLAHQTTILGITRHNSRWLQHISSLAGGIVVLVYTWRWRLVPSPVTEESVRKPGDKILFWAGAFTIGALAAVGALWFYDHLYNWHVLAGYNRTLAIITLGTASWGGTFYAICGYGVAKRFFARRAEAQTFSAK